jgi:CYTH domain-containing protein/thymidylate kinase
MEAPAQQGLEQRRPGSRQSCGPSAGKSTILARATEYLAARGWRVLVVPEPPTLLISGGLSDIGELARGNRAAWFTIQCQILEMYLSLRERFLAVARALPDDHVVLLHDRGALDLYAYSSREVVDEVVSAAGHSKASLTQLYESVLYLQSAAALDVGYTNANYRTETRGEALDLDALTARAWLHHPHLTVVNAYDDFEEKVSVALTQMASILGDHRPVEYERKYLLQSAPESQFLEAAVAVEVTQIYLPLGADGGETRIRRWSSSEVLLHFFTKKYPATQGRYTQEAAIDAVAFDMLASGRDPGTQVVEKTRYLFIAGGQRFALDHIRAPRELWLLEAKIPSPTWTVRPPAVLGPVVDVTSDPRYKNRSIASGT